MVNQNETQNLKIMNLRAELISKCNEMEQIKDLNIRLQLKVEKYRQICNEKTATESYTVSKIVLGSGNKKKISRKLPQFSF